MAFPILLMFSSAIHSTLLSPYRFELLALVAAYAVASLAQNVLAGYANIPSLGNVAFFATSAYTAAWLTVLTHLPAIVAVLVGVLAAGLLGLLIGLPTLRISGMHLAIVSLVLVFAAQEIMTQWDAVHGANGVSIAVPGWLQGRGLFIVATLFAVFSYLLVRNILRSRSGRAILALSDNPSAAATLGIDVVRYRLGAFVLSGLLTGGAGIIYLYYSQTVTPGAFPLDLSLAFLTMIILGGTRSLLGSLLGALIIGLLPQFLALFPLEVGQLPVKDLGPSVYAGLILVTLWFFPQGIWNNVRLRLSNRRDA